MTEVRPVLETRWPCPVCLGVVMSKTRLPDGDLVLDHCGRCGGVWFDAGETAALRAARTRPAWVRLDPGDPHRMRCHHCGALLSRHDDACGACGWKNRILCPSCARTMRRDTCAGVELDACAHCRGVWVDHDELAAVWNLKLEDAALRRGGTAPAAVGDGSLHLVEILVWSPDVVAWGAIQAGRGAVQVAASAPEALGGAGEIAAEAAGSVFDLMVEIIAGLFG